MKRNFVVGVDEVGRGPIAGPVTVGAFSCARKDVRKLVRDAEKFAGCSLKDSKKLSAKRRAAFATFIHEASTQKRCKIHIASKTALAIDTKGIARCIRECVDACVEHVADAPQDTEVLLDAGLRAPAQYDMQQSIVRGDESQPVIALASIIAKEHRDSYMKKIARRVPEYGFERHVGYGTRAHYDAISNNGFHAIHRKTFLKKYVIKSIKGLVE